MSDDQIEKGSTRDYCSRWPNEVNGEGHAFESHKPANSPVWIRRCSFCGWIDVDEFAAALQRAEAERDALLPVAAEAARLRAELEHWTSGRRRKGMPIVESVPDGLQYAAALVREQHADNLTDAQCDLLREAALRLRDITTAASRLTADRDALLPVVDDLAVERTSHQATIAELLEVRAQRDAYAVLIDHHEAQIAALLPVAEAAAAWVHCSPPQVLQEFHDALVAAVDLWESREESTDGR